jgi:hypothetical protein
MTRTRTLPPLVALVVVSLIGAGCRSNSSSRTVPAARVGTAGSTGTASSTRTASSTGNESKPRSPKQQSEALRFARCVRENGVKDFPDPANGERLVDTARIPSSRTPAGTRALTAAMQKCAVTSWEKQRGG